MKTTPAALFKELLTSEHHAEIFVKVLREAVEEINEPVPEIIYDYKHVLEILNENQEIHTNNYIITYNTDIHIFEAREKDPISKLGEEEMVTWNN